MSVTWLLAASLKAGLLLGAAWLVATVLRTAAARHQIWALGVAGALLLPWLAWLLPALPVPAATESSGASFLATAVQISARGVDSTGPAWPTWLALAWAAGTTLVLLRSLAGHLAAHRLARAASAASTPTWLTARHEAAAALAMPERIALARSEAIGSPMTVGLLRVRVLLPAAADAWSPGRLRAVLVHELGHVRRRDNLIQLGAQLACALYWWNPLAWLAAARLRREREHACDDLVLTSGVSPSSYAADLLAVLRDLSPDAAAHAGACMVDRAAGTALRLGRILDAATPRRPPGVWSRRGAGLAALAGCAALACTATPPPRPASSAPTTTASPSRPRGGLTVGEPSVRDIADPDAFVEPSLIDFPSHLSQVAVEVDRHVGELQACYERQLVLHPGLAGEVEMHWVIGEGGKVLEQCVRQETVENAELIACLNDMIKTAHFPAPSGGPVDVTFPFVFAALP